MKAVKGKLYGIPCDKWDTFQVWRGSARCGPQEHLGPGLLDHKIAPMRNLLHLLAFRRSSFAILILVLVLLPCRPSLAQQRAELPPGVKRVLFLGDSITYGGHYVCDVEAYFVTRYPERKIEFINEGLPSETVSGLSEPGHAGGQFPRPDLHERLARVLAGTKADLVFACYGMN